LEPGRINFGAFPRSGNHTLGATLSFSFPDREVFWIRHRIADLYKAPNCAVIVRNPLESISSWIYCNNDDRPDAVEKITDWYCRYMSGIIGSSASTIAFTLESVSVNPYACAKAFANRFSIEDPVEIDVNAVPDWLIENMPDHYPCEKSKGKSGLYSAVMNSSDYDRAVALYNDVIAICQNI
jgi:hypothetical protein